MLYSVRKMGRFVFALFLVTLLSGAYGNCDDFYDCVTCTNHKSWNGERCRWCPLDRACHAYGSLLNACKKEQNIKLPSDCKDKTYGYYNSRTAYEQVLFSAVAYTDDPVTCLEKIFPNGGFEIIQAIGMKCDDFVFDYSECFAYTAISHERKLIVLAFRGTTSVEQLIEEILTVLTIPKTSFKIGGKVQKYFQNANEKLYPCVAQSISELISRYPIYDIQITGHSLGGAIASLASASLIYDKIIPEEKLSLYTFGMPRVGNKDYAFAHDKLLNNSWRVVHYRDLVCHLPTCNLVTGCDVTNGPYHHRTEVFYPNANMLNTSAYIVCKGSDDKNCSNALIKAKPCIIDVKTCIDYHKNYFSIPVGSYCDKQMGRRRRSAHSSMRGQFSNARCRTISFEQPPESSKGPTLCAPTVYLVASLCFGKLQIS